VRRILLAIAAVAAAVPAHAYTRYLTSQGVALTRPDAGSIQFLVHDGFTAGAVNSEGGVTITAGSNPGAALAAAASTWTAVLSATVRFAPFKSTTAGANGTDGQNVITIEDTPENRSAVGSYLAITLYSYRVADGALTDTDIIFSPKVVESGRQVPFSTNHAANTYDVQSTLTHELGHALGASHSGVIGATMFQSAGEVGDFITANEADAWATLSADDVAFVTSAYPAPGAANQLGAIAGTVKFDTGAAVLGALVNAVDAAQGIMLGGFVNSADGSYSIGMAPPGQYQVYAQPLDGPVMPANLGPGVLHGLSAVTNFRTSFSGGNASPATTSVIAGGAATANITVPSGASALHIDRLGTGSAGGTDWAYGDVKSLTGGTAGDILIWGAGVNNTLTESNLRVLGPGLTIRAGSLRRAANAVVSGVAAMRFTVDAAPFASRTPVAVAVVSGSDAAVDSGSLLLLPGGGPPAVLNTGVLNAASFEGGSVSPGGIITVYGTRFGPPPPGLALAQLDGAGRIATQISGVRVLFDGRPSPLIYVGNNVVSAVVPFEVSAQKSTAMTVEYNGSASVPVNAAVGAAGPALFTYFANGSGQVLAVNPDGRLNGPAAAAARGSVIVMYWTGAGLLSPQAGDGVLTPGVAAPVLPVSVTIGGSPANVMYAGAAPAEVAGLEQLNVEVPAGIAPGSAVPVVVTVGDYSSRPDVTLVVK
jgi:uncharacterized protein (TIGR03437 family)